MTRKTLIKLAGSALFCILLIAAVQFACYYAILRGTWPGGRADLIAVFNGDSARIAKGVELANAGVAPLLVISPASKADIALLDRQYRKTGTFRYLIEARADTTWQNALFVGRLAESRHLHSVVLVTSDYHMPRSLLLFSLQLAGSGTRVSTCPLTTSEYSANPLAWSTRQRKRVYNEMVKLWGSLIEKLLYHIQGDIPQRCLKHNKVLLFLKQLLLFEV